VIAIACGGGVTVDPTAYVNAAQLPDSAMLGTGAAIAVAAKGRPAEVRPPLR
jgi:hypothetical protein